MAKHIIATMALAFLVAGDATAADPAAPGQGDGTVQVPQFELPPSEFLSKEAAELLKTQAGPTASGPAMGDGTIEQLRSGTERFLAPWVQTTRARYAVDVVEQRIGGVRTRVFTPRGRQPDRQRVLINLHGGAFSMCAEACAMLESIPISAVGNFKVVSVDYRQGPEHVFPAASQDVAAVYSELLKTYRPKQIGIYGCSAGGALSAQATAWLLARGQPAPGAVGIFGAGAVRSGTGDSSYVSAALAGRPRRSRATPRSVGPRSYFEGADLNDPLVSPGHHLSVLAKFPPTLVLTATRATDLSPAVYTHSQLLKAGVAANLMVAEGLAHCYIMQSQIPESQDAYKAIVNFFRANLR